MSEGEQMGRCRSEMTAAYGARGFKPNDSDLVTADALDRLAADVAAVKAKVDAVSPEDVRHFVDSEKAWVKLVEDQRDAAVRERNESRALLELAQVQRTAAYADRDEARAEVYQLKCSRTETSKERDAAIRERDQWREEARIAVINRDEARAEVERLRGELAAPQPAAPEPAYYLVTNERDMPIHVSRMHPGVGWGGCAITALYAAPQPAGHGISPGLPETQSAGNAAPAPGWLTERERTVLELIAMERRTDSDLHWFNDVLPAIRSLLARAGSPPVVVLPTVFARSLLGDELVALQQVKDAMDKAGVAWKEVGRE